MRPARSALFALFLVVSALLACRKNRPLTLATPANQQVPPSDAGDAGAASHKQINADTYSVECFGTNVECVKVASSVCQKGYDVLASSEGTPTASAPLSPGDPDAGASDAAAPDADAPDVGTPTTDAGAPEALPRIEMVVKCKP